MRNIKISVKLFTLVLILLATIVYIGLYGISNLTVVNKGMTTMYNDRVIPLRQLKIVSDRFAVDIVDVSHKVRNGSMTFSEGGRKIDKALDEINKQWGAYMETQITGKEETLANQVQEMSDKVNQAVLELRTIISKEDTTQLEDFIINRLYQEIDPLTAKIGDLIDIQLKISEEIKAESELIYEETQSSSYVLIGLSIILALGLASYIIMNINKSLREANKVIEELAKGDLTVTIDDMGKDEIGILLLNLRNMVDKLKEVIVFVRQSSENIASASQQLSQGATEQASSTEEVSSSMEEMTANIQQNTDNAQQTEKIAIKATDDIKDGSRNVNSTVESMKTIADKISIIGEIAFQTNILALNAAVEAARAGEHGKGFAVVAAEVRKLAERSQKAAAEIDQVSKTSVDVAVRSGSLLNEIVPNIQNTSKLVQEITAASLEQNAGTGQINDAIQQLNQVTQQNAASAEELSSQAVQMQEAIEFFKIESNYMAKQKKNVQKVNISHLNKDINQHGQKGVNFNLNSNTNDDGYEHF